MLIFCSDRPETGEGLLEDVLIQAFVKDVGESGDGGTPGHGEQVTVVAARWQVEEETFRVGAAMQ